MKKRLFLGLLVVGLFIVIGCLPPAAEEGTLDESALAGQAIALGSQNTFVLSCTESGNTVTGTVRSSSRGSTRFNLTDNCVNTRGGIVVGQDFSCASSTRRQVIRTQCTSGEVCLTGRCVVCTPSAEICDGVDNSCNGQVDEGGLCNTNTSCGTFGNTCAVGQRCRNETCRNESESHIICNDYDGGLGYYQRSSPTLNYSNGNLYGTSGDDYCQLEINLIRRGSQLGDLIEFYCTEDHLIDYVAYTCPNGCSAGSCIPDFLFLVRN